MENEVVPSIEEENYNPESHFLSFEQAREFVHALQLKKENDWWKYSTSSKKPTNIPFTPWREYQDKWKGWTDWLGTGKIRYNFLSFEEARDYVRTLRLASSNKWKDFCKSGNKPHNIPSIPNQTYKEKWKGWGNWLGTGRIWTRTIKYLPFEQAREYVRSLGFENLKEWREFCKSGKKPSNIPLYPHQTYWKEWTDWRNWLKNSEMEVLPANSSDLEDDVTKALDVAIDEIGSKFLPFEQAREFVRSLNLKGQNKWWAFTKSGQKPPNIPSSPHKIYRKEWKGYVDWLGTEKTSSNFLPFEQARDYVRSLRLASSNKWKDFCKSGKKPNNIPNHPDQKYKKEWEGWGDWLGTGRIGPRTIKYLPFEQVREYVRSLGLENPKEWHDFCKSGKKPSNIPTDPSVVYWQYWEGWPDWFGNVYLPFEKAREYVRSFGLNINQWDKFVKSKIKPHNIPEDPWRVYGVEWKNMADWLGTDKTFKSPPYRKTQNSVDWGITNASLYDSKFLPFEKAREYVRSLKINPHGWYSFCQSGKLPHNIPTNPGKAYSKEWKNMEDWLGT